MPLAVAALLPRLTAALASGPAAILVAPPGSGKTTLVPPALFAARVGGGRRLVLLQPRRIAARAAARRIAELCGVELGQEVGYQVRFDHRAGPATSIVVVTDGILVQMLQSDPFLEGIGTILFDEVHERTLATDLALAMARRVQREARPDLRLLAMSATIDPGPLAAFLGDCPVFTAGERPFPVEIAYVTPASARSARAVAAAGGTAGGGAAEAGRRLTIEVVAAVRRALDATEGDVLVFLPGRGEIQRTAAALSDLAANRGLMVAELYGDLPPELQDAALRPAARRRIVLATNVAETSVTVEGVTAVVDSGLARRLRYDPASGLDRLELGRISRAAADQRAGRAGRQGPGLCLRLWPAHEHAARPALETPEIARVDLAGPALQLLAWGESDLASFGWFEAPSPAALAAARALLVRLGALAPGEDATGEAAGIAPRGTGVTADGQAMARLPLHPRLARLLLAGHHHGVARDAALAAALLAERDPFPRPTAHRGHAGASGDRAMQGGRSSRSDILDRVDALDQWEKGGGGAAVSAGAARFILRARDQLADLARQHLEPRRPAPGAAAPVVAPQQGPNRRAGDEPRSKGLLRSLLAAYPDRVARRRAPHDRRALLAGGRGVRLSPESAVLEDELFICVDVTASAGGGEDLVRLASAVEPEWLAGPLLRTGVETAFDAERQRVTAWRRTRYDGLLIDEREALPDAAEAAALLTAAAAASPAAALPLDDPAVAGFITRWRWLAGWMPELDLPALDDTVWRQIVPLVAAGRRSFAELRRAPLLEILRGLLSPAQLAALEREAPERLPVPSGSRVPLRYEEGKPPILAARIQELFGLAETPRIAAGRVAVLLHLLAPNHRPQQVTTDLRSFWETIYPVVRKELQGRYPRHAWPQDPRSAPAERRPAPRRPR